MRNIVKMLSSTEFKRVRIGSKQDENSPIPVIDYVLTNIDKSYQESYKNAFEKVSKAISDFISGVSFDIIMGKYNG